MKVAAWGRKELGRRVFGLISLYVYLILDLGVNDVFEVGSFFDLVFFICS